MTAFLQLEFSSFHEGRIALFSFMNDRSVLDKGLRLPGGQAITSVSFYGSECYTLSAAQLNTGTGLRFRKDVIHLASMVLNVRVFHSGPLRGKKKLQVLY